MLLSREEEDIDMPNPNAPDMIEEWEWSKINDELDAVPIL